MFKKNTLVAWATKNNTFMGKVLDSNEKTTTVFVTSTATKERHYEGAKYVVSNSHLGEVVNRRTTVTVIKE